MRADAGDGRSRRRRVATRTALVVIAAATLVAAAGDDSATPSPRDDRAVADGVVRVFIVMGQSNVLEMGRVRGDAAGTLEHAVRSEERYPFLVDESGAWITRRDVRNVHVMGSGGPGRLNVKRNDWLTISGGKIGIEIGIGHRLGDAIDAPVLVLRSAIGNRSLGWDLLPPDSPSYEFVDPRDGKTWTYAGFGQTPLRWERGTEPEPIGWTAGIQYVGDVARAKAVLEDIGTYVPGATGHEVAGFLWWQGDKDRYDPGHAARYERNLVALIAALRRDFDAPDAPFVCATLGQTDRDDASGAEKAIIDAQFAISDPDRHPELAGSVATVYTHPLSMGSSSNAHYGGDARTYMNVGLAMGEAMVRLLRGDG